MSGVELLPCPFCGGASPEVRSNGIGDYYVFCGGDETQVRCGASTSDMRCETQEGAANRWNRRAALSALPSGGDVERVARAIVLRLVGKQAAELDPASDKWASIIADEIRAALVPGAAAFKAALRATPATPPEVKALVEKVRLGGHRNPSYVGTWNDVESAMVMLEVLAATSATGSTVERCAEALKPFAELAAGFKAECWEDDSKMLAAYGRGLTVGDLRRAAEVYRALSGEAAPTADGAETGFSACASA